MNFLIDLLVQKSFTLHKDRHVEIFYKPITQEIMFSSEYTDSTNPDYITEVPEGFYKVGDLESNSLEDYFKVEVHDGIVYIYEDKDGQKYFREEAIFKVTQKAKKENWYSDTIKDMEAYAGLSKLFDGVICQRCDKLHYGQFALCEECLQHEREEALKAID